MANITAKTRLPEGGWVGLWVELSVFKHLLAGITVLYSLCPQPRIGNLTDINAGGG